MLHSVDDIRDEEDIYDALVIRQKPKKKKTQTLTQKVDLINKNLNLPKLQSPPKSHFHSKDVALVCDMILDNFDSLNLHENLGSADPETLLDFRLFIFTIKHQQHQMFPIDENTKKHFIEVFNHLSHVRELDHDYESKFVQQGHSLPQILSHSHNTKTTVSIKIPRSIKRLLNIDQ